MKVFYICPADSKIYGHSRSPLYRGSPYQPVTESALVGFLCPVHGEWPPLLKLRAVEGFRSKRDLLSWAEYYGVAVYLPRNP